MTDKRFSQIMMLLFTDVGLPFAIVQNIFENFSGLPFAIVQNIFENFSVQCQLVIEATMKARQRWSKNNALAELCSGD